jgi:hypothetical protein
MPYSTGICVEVLCRMAGMGWGLVRKEANPTKRRGISYCKNNYSVIRLMLTAQPHLR